MIRIRISDPDHHYLFLLHCIFSNVFVTRSPDGASEKCVCVCVTNIIVVTEVRMIVHGTLMVVVIKCHLGEEMNKLPSNQRATTERANHKREIALRSAPGPGNRKMMTESRFGFGFSSN